MPSLNKIILIGYAGTDPEMRYTPTGKAVTDFRLAVRDTARSSKNHAEWFTVTCWDRVAEITNQYVAKGRLIYCEGRFQLQRFTDAEGKARSQPRVVASTVTVLDAPRSETAAAS